MSVLVENLSKNYGSQVALKSISLQIKPGEIVGLLGANGAGKSTLMKTICGILDIQDGSIEIDGFFVEAKNTSLKNKVGFLAENNPLYKEMYVREFLWFVSNLRKVSKERVREVIQKVGLTNNTNKKISELSKGYKQRLGIAQAILNDPPILILDEPTNGLDPNQIEGMRNLISNLGKDKTILISTHILQEVEALCSRIILLNNGKIVADKKTEEFKGKFKNIEEAFYNYSKNE